MTQSQRMKRSANVVCSFTSSGVLLRDCEWTTSQTNRKRTNSKKKKGGIMLVSEGEWVRNYRKLNATTKRARFTIILKHITFSVNFSIFELRSGKRPPIRSRVGFDSMLCEVFWWVNELLHRFKSHTATTNYERFYTFDSAIDAFVLWWFLFISRP